MKFAHFADVHIGCYRDPELTNVSTLAFSKAIDISIEENVDFVLIAGDIFNTALPDINHLKITTERLRNLKEAGIPCYIIPGSHDYSTSGKTMLDVLEQAGLFTNVVKTTTTPEGKLKLHFTIDEKTGAKITGMMGKKGGLESAYYKDIDYSALEAEDGYKIFMFHTMITELKPKNMEQVSSFPLTILPRTFNYYAGGHVHIIKEVPYGKGQAVYPGPVFPANFQELEDLGKGNMFIVHTDGKTNILERKEIKIFDTHRILIDAEKKSPTEIEEILKELVKTADVTRKIVLIRIRGTLASGKPADVNMSEIFELFYDKGAFFVMKNTMRFVAPTVAELKTTSENTSEEDIEQDMIKEHLDKLSLEGYEHEELIKTLLTLSNDEKKEGETVTTFERRIIKSFNSIFGIDTKLSEEKN